MLVFENFNDMAMDIAEQVEKDAKDLGFSYSKLSVAVLVVHKVKLENNPKRLNEVWLWLIGLCRQRDEETRELARDLLDDSSDVSDIED